MKACDAANWPWVCLVPGGAFMVFVCWRCDARVGLMLPCSLSEVSPLMNTFGRRHKRCRPSLHGMRRQLTRTLRNHIKGGQDGDFLRLQNGDL